MGLALALNVVSRTNKSDHEIGYASVRRGAGKFESSAEIELRYKQMQYNGGVKASCFSMFFRRRPKCAAEAYW